MAQFQIKNWDDKEHKAAKLTAIETDKTLHQFIVEAIWEKVQREGRPDVVVAIRKGKTKKVT